jgi:hypothetical protein
MPTSHYFPLYYKNDGSEQNLYQDLVDEQIRLFGSDIYYITRKTIRDQALNQIVFSEFSEKIVIEAMLQNVEGFGNQSEFISKFGLRVTDEITFTMSVRRWEQESTRLNNLEVESRPNEGDLIFFPLTGDLYEIKFVEREAPFYQLGKLYFFTMTCEIYEVGSEDIDTGIPEIDDIEADNDYATSFVLADGGTGNYYIGDKVEFYTDLVIGNLANPTGIKGEVSDWDAPSRRLELINVTGDWDQNYYVGRESGADTNVNTTDGIYQLGTQAEFTDIDDANTDFDDNKYIEEAADDILLWTESNPFGEVGNQNGNF